MVTQITVNPLSRTGLDPALGPLAATSTSTVVNQTVVTLADLSSPAANPASAVAGSQGTAGVLRFPGDLPVYYMTLGINSYKRAGWASIGELSVDNTIALPLPQQLMDTQSVTYEQIAIGVPGQATMGAVGAVTGNTPNAIQQALAGLPGMTASLLANVMQKIEAQAGGILTTGATAGLLAGAGFAVNDFMTVMLRGPSYKQREFTWKFSPRNSAESQQLEWIRIMLLNAAAPGYSGAGTAFFTWPKIFKVKFRHKDGVDMETRLFEMKPMVLVNAVFNHTPAGVPGFYASTQRPEGLEMHLQFSELELFVNKGADTMDAYRGGFGAVDMGDGLVTDASFLAALKRFAANSAPTNLP